MNKLYSIKILCEYISNVVGSLNIVDMYCTGLHYFLYVVVADVYVLSLLFLSRVLGQEN